MLSVNFNHGLFVVSINYRVNKLSRIKINASVLLSDVSKLPNDTFTCKCKYNCSLAAVKTFTFTFFHKGLDDYLANIVLKLIRFIYIYILEREIICFLFIPSNHSHYHLNVQSI